MTSGSDSLFQALEQSAMWRTKSRPARSWRSTWKKETYLPRLFGLTYEPSTVARGAARWISSLADTPASRSATQGSASEQTTPGTCGLPWQPSSETSNPSGASSRTSVLICDSDSTKSPETFKAWATALRRHCLQRRKSALLTAANGSSSWPTARASYNENRNTQPAPSHGVTHGRTLSGEAIRAMRNWQTPNAASEAPNLGSNIKNGPKSLLAQAEQTTRALWQTPTVGNTTGGNKNRGGDRSTELLLPGQAEKTTQAMWQTPAVFQGRLRRQVGQTERAEELLPAQAESVSGRLAQMTMRGGLLSSLPEDWTSSRLRLNPRFVEWLMGWEEGWVALPNSTSSGMA